MTDHDRHLRPAVALERLGTCTCCGGQPTHVGMDGSRAVVSGCRWLVGAWVRDPDVLDRVPVGEQREPRPDERYIPARYQRPQPAGDAS